MTTKSAARQLYKVKAFAEKHSGWLTERALRAIILRAKNNQNPFKDAFLRCSRTVLVDEGRFFEILDGQQENQK